MATITGDQSTGGQIPFFLSNVLSTPAGALPKGAQWVLWFQGDPDYTEVVPVEAIKAGISFEPNTWEIDSALKIALQDQYHKTKGCMFAQAVQIPGEGNQVNTEGIMLNGYIRGTVGAGREAYNGMQIVFLETNVSFVDNVIRPWTIATSHLGMIARSGKLNYRCKISAWKLGVTSPGEPPIVLQEYTFYGACPITIDGEEYNYSQTSAAINRNTTFTYYYYKLKSYIDDSYNNKLIIKNIQAKESTVTNVAKNIQAKESTITNVAKNIQAKESTVTNVAKNIQAKESTVIPAPPFIIPFSFFNPPLQPIIPVFDIQPENPQIVIIPKAVNTPTTLPVITPSDVTAPVNTPVITPGSEILTTTQSNITPTNNTEQRNNPVIISKTNQIDANTLVRQNIINAGLPSKEPNTPPIILQQAPRPITSPINIV
jgi:hypothetical protein